MKVLVADVVGEEGIALLRSCADVDIKPGLKPDELVSIICNYDALVVRSQTKVTSSIIEAGKKLQVIGRAGVGVDNIDVDAATRMGIVVVNAPSSNTISAAEHTIALILSLARHIPRANTSLKAGEWKRNEFTGIEVRNKTLGLVGLGNVGAAVARRAAGLEMKLIGYDPFVSAEIARNIGVTIMPLEQLMKEADFITLHVPLTNSTKNIIGAKELALVKPTARLVNTARGGLVDEEALVEVLNEGRMAGAAFDVFTTEPITDSILFKNDKIIVTPHLGASTVEAQALVSADVAEQIIDIFNGQPARYAVNAPFISAEVLTALKPFIRTASVAGKLAGQLADGQMKSVRITYEGEIANYDTNVLKAAVIGGLLAEISEERVNLVNANLIAARRGFTVLEQKEITCANYVNLITVEMTSNKGKVVIATTLVQDATHIVRVNDYWIDIYPTEGYFMFSDHLDRPGLLGAVGRVTGDANIAITSMHVGRLQPRGQALMILALDEPLSDAQRKKILAIPDIYSAKLVKL
ncbi:MAG TPA: phosphoglycerate dehydrogenase [Dehalococcoidales bacterium]|nr:phosphoglycerate dehydrogenase [Dehalococcoidales bacterium]